MLSAFFYSPFVGLTSYLCEFDINSSLFCLATKMHDIYEERIHIPAYVHVYIYIHIYYNDISSLMHFKNITKPAKRIKWNQCVCTQHVVFA